MQSATRQTTLEDGVPLREVEFVVVDLETTGGSPRESRITEIGAVRVRGGERIGTFQTLVIPGVPIPRFITYLTGIDDFMVRGAPPIEGGPSLVRSSSLAARSSSRTTRGSTSRS